MGNYDKINNSIDFTQDLKNYELSLRGDSIEIYNGKSKRLDLFPPIAGSVFISKLMAHFRTILIGINSLSKLSKDHCKSRIYANGETLYWNMAFDPTVDEENMFLIAEGANNIFFDSFLGLRKDGHLSVIVRDYKNENTDLVGDDERLLDDDEEEESR